MPRSSMPSERKTIKRYSPRQSLPNDVLLMIGDEANDPRVLAALSACSRDLQRRTEPSLYRTFIQTGGKGTAMQGFISAIAAKPYRAKFVQHITAKHLLNYHHNSLLDKRTTDLIITTLRNYTRTADLITETIIRCNLSRAIQTPRMIKRLWLQKLYAAQAYSFDWDVWIALLLLISAPNLRSLTLLGADTSEMEFVLEVIWHSIEAQRIKSLLTTDCMTNLRTIRLDFANTTNTMFPLELYPFVSLESVRQLETNITEYNDFRDKHTFGDLQTKCTHLVLRPEKHLPNGNNVGTFLKLYPRLKSCIYIAPGKTQARRMRRIHDHQEHRFHLSCQQFWAMFRLAVISDIKALPLSSSLFNTIQAGFNTKKLVSRYALVSHYELVARNQLLEILTKSHKQLVVGGRRVFDVIASALSAIQTAFCWTIFKIMLKVFVSTVIGLHLGIMWPVVQGLSILFTLKNRAYVLFFSACITVASLLLGIVCWGNDEPLRLVLTINENQGWFACRVEQLHSVYMSTLIIILLKQL